MLHASVLLNVFNSISYHSIPLVLSVPECLLLRILFVFHIPHLILLQSFPYIFYSCFVFADFLFCNDFLLWRIIYYFLYYPFHFLSKFFTVCSFFCIYQHLFDIFSLNVTIFISRLFSLQIFFPALLLYFYLFFYTVIPAFCS